jgi:adenine deaminase
MKIFGQLVDIHKKDIYPTAIIVTNGIIESIMRVDYAPSVFIMPGLIDAHIHIESSMVTPGAFARAAVRHGTSGVVSDPHEIANVLGVAGVKFMLSDAGKVPVKFWFGAPSCVPATSFENSGAVLNKDDIEKLLSMPEIKFLAEMMNFPGVIFGDKDVHAKLGIAKKLHKPVDGHAPGLSGEELKKYISSGISTDHECSLMNEALEKISYGMKVLIREGSAARNLDSLKGLFSTHPEMIMLCSDDLHPEMLEKRHINKLIGGLISEGYDVFDVIRSATLNPVNHYTLDAGLLREGDPADFILVDNLKGMNVLETWIDGIRVYQNGKVLFDYHPGKAINNFNCKAIEEAELRVSNRHGKIRVIEAFDGELLTKEVIWNTGNSDTVDTDTENDILKIVVKDRYKDGPCAVGFIRGFRLKDGAFASSVAHDSHNIIAVGSNDKDLAGAINEIVRLKGGLAVSCKGTVHSLQLNIAGIMTTRSCEEVAVAYGNLNKQVRSLGCTMKAPYMTLSFMALLVIPELKIGDKGLFDVKKFELVSLFM